MYTKPKWIIPVGIIKIILGALGLYNATQLIIMPSLLEVMSESMTSAASAQSSTSDEITEMMEKMYYVPDWFGTFGIVMGILGILISSLIIAAGIILLLGKKFALKLFYTSCIIAILYALIKATICIAAGSLMVISLISGAVFGVIAYTILAIVAFNSDKSYFLQPVEEDHG